MKTLIPLSFPMFADVELNTQIIRLIEEEEIVQLFYYPKKNSHCARLFILTPNKIAAVLCNQKWVDAIQAKKRIQLHFADAKTVAKSQKKGIPFYSYYYNARNCIYLQAQSSNLLGKKRCILNNLKFFKNTFKSEHILLLSQVKTLHNAEDELSCLLAFYSLYSKVIGKLEEAYKGASFLSGTLHERIAELEILEPGIKKIFGKKNADDFYLLALLEAAKKSSETSCEIDFDLSLYSALLLGQAQLCKALNCRLKTIKKKLKFARKSNSAELSNGNFNTKTMLIKHLVEKSVRFASPEEIYLFNTCIFNQSGASGTASYLFYILLVGDSIDKEKLQLLQETVALDSHNHCGVVAIAHSRYAIQEKLDLEQGFFRPIMSAENRIYTSDQHPDLHWHDWSTTSHSDLKIYQERTKTSICEFQAHCKNKDQVNYLKTWRLFASSFRQLLLSYSYEKLHGYTATDLDTYSLWKLIVYVAPQLSRLEYLYKKYHPNFFKIIDREGSMNNYNSNLTTAEQLLQLEEILCIVYAELSTPWGSLNAPELNVGYLL